MLCSRLPSAGWVQGTWQDASHASPIHAGACFWALGGRSDSETAIYSTLGALLVASLFLGILNSIFVQPVIASERQVFYRERAAGMYSVFPWYLGMVSLVALCIWCCAWLQAVWHASASPPVTVRLLQMSVFGGQ